MTEREKMLRGDPYRACDPELVAARARAADVLRRFNTQADSAGLLQLFGTVGANAAIVPWFHCDYGAQIHAGRNLFVNAGCVFLDCAEIRIGDDVQIGPAVQLYTATHPLDAAQTRTVESARPIHIGNDVWLGGGSVVLPGVSIGHGAVIGAGSVVTRDVPPGVLAHGNPCRVVRALT